MADGLGSSEPARPPSLLQQSNPARRGTPGLVETASLLCGVAALAPQWTGRTIPVPTGRTPDGWSYEKTGLGRVPPMPDAPKAPDPALQTEAGPQLLSAISREIVRAMKTYYGRGPSKVKSYLVDDLLFVVMRGGTTEAEKTMLDAGEEDVVREFRQRFENVMADRLIGTIEQLTDRKVLTYQSQILFDPDTAVEIFVFDKLLPREALEETARSLLAEDGEDGTILGDEPETAG